MNLKLFLNLIINYGILTMTCLRNLFCKKQFILLFFILIASPLSFAKEALPVAENPEIEKRMIILSEELRCLVCQNESLAGSRSDFAKDIRREIREQLLANKSDKEITDFLVARYGDFVLYRPPVRTNTMILWFGPFAFLLVGGALLFLFLKKRRKSLQEVPLTNEQLKQAENLLKESSDGDNK